MYENVFHTDQQKKMHVLVNTVQKKGNSVRGKKIVNLIRHGPLVWEMLKLVAFPTKKKAKNNNAKKLNKQALETWGIVLKTKTQANVCPFVFGGVMKGR